MFPTGEIRKGFKEEVTFEALKDSRMWTETGEQEEETPHNSHGRGAVDVQSCLGGHMAPERTRLSPRNTRAFSEGVAGCIRAHHMHHMQHHMYHTSSCL